MDAWMRSDLSDGQKGLNRYSSTNETSEMQNQPTIATAFRLIIFGFTDCRPSYGPRATFYPITVPFFFVSLLAFRFFWYFFPLMSWKDTSVGGDEDYGVKSTMSRTKRVAEAAQSYGLEKENKSRGRSKAKVGDRTSERKRAGVSVSWRGVGLLVFHLSA